VRRCEAGGGKAGIQAAWRRRLYSKTGINGCVNGRNDFIIFIKIMLQAKTTLFLEGLKAQQVTANVQTLVVIFSMKIFFLISAIYIKFCE
jgi:hypothetical protein